MKKRIKTGGALILAAVLAVSAFALPKAFAAVGVDVDAKCDLTVDVRGAGYSELISDSVIIDLYKVADIAVTGAYDSLLEDVDFSDINSGTTAADWEEKTLAIVDNLEGMDITYSKNTDGGLVTFEDIDTGLYLVYAEQMLSRYNQYDFKPYLISLPNNYWNNFARENEIPEDAKEDGKVTDKWIYNFTVSLKPSKTDLYGDLYINKDLTVYNASLGPAYFVYQVEAVKEDCDTKEKRIVYSDVVSMEFNEAGSKQLVINDIPAGAVVTVTEVYSGASYELKSDKTIETVIEADGSELYATAEFVNEYNEGLNTGSGVVNSYTYSAESKTWDHSDPTDSLTTPEE